MVNILSGARQEEREAAAKKRKRRGDSKLHRACILASCSHDAVCSATTAVMPRQLTSLVGRLRSARPRSRARPNGKPDLNGIWQTMGRRTGIWSRTTPQAGPVIAMGALGAIPGGLGVVEGGRIPYKPEAAKQRDGEQGEMARARSAREVQLARRAARDVLAASVPDRAGTQHAADHLRVRRRRSHRLHESARHAGAGRFVDGLQLRPLGRRHAGDRRHRADAGELARQRRQLSRARR